MVAYKIDKFGGMLPALDDRLLPEASAAYSKNSYLYSGSLIGWRVPKLLYNLTQPGTRKAYRIPVNGNQTAITDGSYWMEFDDADTDVVRTPVIDDVFFRFYIASPSLPPRYNTFGRIATGQPTFWLGVPAPTTIPGVSATGGGAGLAVARAYLYTYVTEYGEESSTSPILVAHGYDDDVWTISMTPPNPDDMGVVRNITKTRVYRTVTGSTGSASYFLVAELPANTISFVDGMLDEQIALNSQLESLDFTPPPNDLKGIIMGPNGMMAGWRKNEIWFSEPFRPHAWPSKYVQTTEFPIIGIGMAGQSFVACTDGYPEIFQGVSPEAITSTAVRTPEPCTCRGSIISSPQAGREAGGAILQGVYYTSPNGLIEVSASGVARNVTEQYMTRERWAALVPMRSVRAARINTAYVGLGSVFFNPALGLDDASLALDGFYIDDVMQNPLTKFNKLTAPNDLDVFNLYLDFWTGVPLTIQDDKVYYYDFEDADPTVMPYVWKSKVYQQGSKKNFEAMRIWFEVPGNTPAQNSTRNTDPTQPALSEDQFGIIRVYADGILRTTREIRTSGELLRILSGFKAEFWQFEIEARVRVLNFQVATSVKELGQV